MKIVKVMMKFLLIILMMKLYKIYGIMNMTGVFAGAAVTQLLGKWTDGGSLGEGFAMLSIVVALALGLQLYFLRPKTDNME